MAVNAKKSARLRFGLRYKMHASVMVCGCPVNCVTSARYLGVGLYVEWSYFTNVLLLRIKPNFIRPFNCIVGKIGRIASEEVIFALIKSKCNCRSYFMGHCSSVILFVNYCKLLATHEGNSEGKCQYFLVYRVILETPVSVTQLFCRLCITSNIC